MIEHSGRIVAGRQAIAIDSQTPPALLVSGSAVVFAVDRETGRRIQLFSLDPGDPVLPLASEIDAGFEVAAVPLEPIALQPLKGMSDAEGIWALENWLAKIGEALQALLPAQPFRTAEEGKEALLDHGQRLAVQEGLNFVRMTEGDGLLAGAHAAAGLTVALTPGLWLEANVPGGEGAKWKVLEPADVEAAASVLRLTLDLTVPVLFEALRQLRRSREEADRQRFAARQQLNADVTLAALKDLASIAGTARASPEAERETGETLVDSIRLVADRMGFTAHSVTGSPAGSASAIANAFGLRARSVALTGAWWQRDSGPLVAFRAGGNAVALLPGKAGLFGKPHYWIVDPGAGSVRAGSATAADFRMRGLMLYRPLPEDLSVRSLLSYALFGHGPDLRTVAIAGLAATLLGLAAPQGAALLIGQAIPDGDTNTIRQIALGTVAAAFGSALFLLTQSVATLRAQTAAYNALQSGVWDYLLKLGPAFFRGFTAGQLRMRADSITRIHQMMTADALRSLFAGAASFLTLALILWYSPGLFLIALVSGLIVVAASWFGGRALCRMQTQWLDKDEILSGFLLQAVNAVSKLRVAGAADRAFSAWARQYSRKQKLSLAIQTVRDRIQIVNMTAPGLALALGFLYLLSSPAPLGSFLAAIVAMAGFLAALTSASAASAAMVLTVSLWQRMSAILRAKTEVDGTKRQPGRLRGAISVESLTFRYRADGPLILDSVSLRAEPGECIALTGPSGSGKSTLLNLILRFETPASGAIYLDGRELSSLDIGAVRRQVGVVTQDGRLTSGSIFENISCGGVHSMDQAWDAARGAGFAEDIEAMPMGMHTIVSEGGGNLSGGQRQRLLIARALVLKPALLLFDEATSALDNRTQTVVTESLKKIRATRILIAHRLSTIRNADRIYVIDKGRVVQEGKYEELIAAPGLFSRLAARQRL